MMKRIAIAILLLPLAEIVAFVLLATMIGFGLAILVVLASTLAGFLILREAGRGGLSRLREAVDGRSGATLHVQAGPGDLFTVLSGLLLFVPGLLTSLAGVLLLIGPARQAFGLRFVEWMRRGATQPPPGTVDLDPNEWSQVPERKISDDSKRD